MNKIYFSANASLPFYTVHLILLTIKKLNIFTCIIAGSDKEQVLFFQNDDDRMTYMDYMIVKNCGICDMRTVDTTCYSRQFVERKKVNRPFR